MKINLCFSYSDCCHELLGHMPLLANPSFAQFSQELGLASLGASDDDVDKLATVSRNILLFNILSLLHDFQLYFFTVEFGLCKQDGEMKVYGAGLLSSVAELRHAIETKDKVKRFIPELTCKQECIITAFQNAYWYTDSFEEAKEKMRYLSTYCFDFISYIFVVFLGNLQNRFRDLLEFVTTLILKAWKY